MALRQQYSFWRWRTFALIAFLVFLLSSLAGTLATAQPRGRLVSLFRPAQVAVNSSFISPLVELSGRVSIGQKSFIASNTILQANPGTSICIGNTTNLQDNIRFLAQRDLPAPQSTCGPRSASTQDRVSIAHQAVIRNSQIGNFTFVGFRSRITNSVLEDGAFILHGATVSNVRIPKDRLVPIGAVITTQAQANALPLKTEANAEFQEEVLAVNEEFAESYPDLYRREGFDAVTGTSVAPQTSWNPNPVPPTLGANVRLDDFARIVGDVRLGANSTVGERTSIRADEGAPIIIGNDAEIDDRVTFHALKGTEIRIGNHLNSGDNVVFHGPLTVGDDLTIGDDAILFRSQVGNRVTLGEGAIVVGVTLKDGAQVPANAVITTQDQADQLQISPT